MLPEHACENGEYLADTVSLENLRSNAGRRDQRLYIVRLKMEGVAGLRARVEGELDRLGAGKPRPGDWESSVYGASDSRMDRQLRRSGVPAAWRVWFCEKLGSKWGASFASYAGLAADSRSLGWLAMVAQRLRATDEEELIACLKSVSRLAIEYSVYCGFGPYSLLMDIHVLGGYDTVLNRVDVMANIRSEVGVVPPPMDAALSSRLMERVRHIVRSNFAPADNAVSFEHFVSFRDAWATPGASTLEGCAVMRASDGYEVKLKGKFASALQYSDRELVDACKAGSPAIVKPFRKGDEPVKTRVVYGYDFLSYLRCSWFDTFFSTIEAGGAWTPIGYGRGAKADMRLSIRQKLLEGRSWAVSLDQSAFDQHQRKEWVRCAMEEIIAAAARCAPEHLRAEVEDLGRAELSSFDGAYVPGVCRWEIGVPSGLKWTALIDSILNRAAAELVAEDLGFSVELAYYQGDDAVLFGNGCSDPREWASAYERLGLEVNGDKTWISRHSCDFLHEVYTADDCRAFPARIGKSLVWKKPSVGGSTQSKFSRLTEVLSDCLKGVRRGLGGARRVAEKSLSRFVKDSEFDGVWSADLCSEILETPLFLGGFGFGWGGRAALSISGGDVVAERYTVVSKVPSVAPALRPALVARLAAGAFLRTTVTRVAVVRVRGLPENEPFRSYGEHSGIKMQWNVRDGVPWAKQLALELGRRGLAVRLSSSDIPDSRLRYCRVGSALAAMSAFDRAVGSVSWSVEDGETTAESYLYGADWAHHFWQGVCAHWAMGSRRDGGFLGRMAKMVKGALLAYCRTTSFVLPVRV